MGTSNFDKLRNADIVSESVPQEYLDVIEGLTKQEVDVLIKVRRRLDAADRYAGHRPAAPGDIPHALSVIRL